MGGEGCIALTDEFAKKAPWTEPEPPKPPSPLAQSKVLAAICRELEMDTLDLHSELQAPVGSSALKFAYARSRNNSS